jgi:DNA-binding MarR family transcriptional regulator
MSDPFALDQFLPYQLAVLAGYLSRDFSAVYQQKFGLSRAEWRVMAYLSLNTGVSGRDIHARVDMDKSKVSRAASRLQELGVITKQTSPRDRRLVVLQLTPKGEAMMAELTPVAEAYDAEIIAKLGPDAEAFLRGIKTLCPSLPAKAP